MNVAKSKVVPFDIRMGSTRAAREEKECNDSDHFRFVYYLKYERQMNVIDQTSRLNNSELLYVQFPLD